MTKIKTPTIYILFQSILLILKEINQKNNITMVFVYKLYKVKKIIALNQVKRTSTEILQTLSKIMKRAFAQLPIF